MPGPRVYERHEVEEMIPKLEEVLLRLDAHRDQLQTLKIRINALEMIWGEAIHEDSCADHKEFKNHMHEMEKVQGFFKRCADEITELGGQVKGLDPPLIDFYGIRDGHLAFWCWTRGENQITHWHHLDEGFSERQTVVD
jgi:hypothetical protein